MERKGTSVVTAESLGRGLKKAQTTTREEQALRMKYGATVERTAALPRVVEADSELADELLLIEVSLLRAMKQRAAGAKAKAAPAPRNATKSKIVSALRSKKK